MTSAFLRKWVGILFLVLLLNTGYIWAFANPTVFYMGNVLLHLCLGTGLFLLYLVTIGRDAGFRRGTLVAGAFFTIAFLLGAFLAVKGSTTEFKMVWWAHIAAGLLVTLAAATAVLRSLGGFAGHQYRQAFTACAIFLGVLPLAVQAYKRVVPDPYAKIVNPQHVPETMAEEGGGPTTPFFPSSAKTNVGGIIPSNFFMDSKACGECHQDAYKQWESSMHHFASFNNQFYRKSIEYMQSVVGTQPSKWCAGCHDHAVFFNGRFEKPIKDQIDTPEAHAGLACTSCHSITNVQGSMGNGGFTIEYPPLHEYMTSNNKYVKAFNHFMTYLNPEPHKRSFMKPFMRSSSEFCSSCHKVHLDVPVNDYRWFRGFNDYDNWQSSGFGEGARSFYYPPKSVTCSGCHMPEFDSKDPGNKDGKIHSHRFAAGNMAVPTANKDEEQLKATEAFLKSGFISVDIFGASEVEEGKGQTGMVRRIGDAPQAMSGGGVGEEVEQSGTGIIREVGNIAAPIDKAGAVFKPGSTVRIDTVVRTRKIGHFFPGGTIDAFDVWLEFEAKDADGKTIYLSGKIENDGLVEPGAHFYKAYQLDGEGNPINKRNAWQARSVLYVRLIGPGSADTAHFRLKIPKDVRGPIALSAKLNYRKFGFYSQFAYAGKPEDDPSKVTKSFDNRHFTFDAANIPTNVSGKIKDRIPELPVTVLAKAEAKLMVGNANTKTEWKQVVSKEARERWNDWSIGMLQQGDLKAAEYGFKKVTVAEPEYADGWLNVARALIQEGETDAAKPFIEKALAINNKLGRIWYFKGLIEKSDGDYDAALVSFRTAESMYPRDRVVLNQIARMLFLKREYKQAIDVLDRVRAIDPEDLQMHYTAMLACRGLGDSAGAEREQKLFMRFKAEESAQAITAKRRAISPEDNNERQQIHDHDSVDLNRKAQPATPVRQVTKPSNVARAY